MGSIGGGGRGKKKKSQHFNLTVRDAYRTKGVRIVYLPPYCPYLNPVELLFHDLKDHYIRPSYHRDGSPLQFEEVERIVKNYIAIISHPIRFLASLRHGPTAHKCGNWACSICK